MQLKIISTLIFLAVVCLVIGIYRLRIQGQEYIKQRLENAAKGLREDADEQSNKPHLFDMTVLFRAMGRSFTNFSFSYKLAMQLSKADLLFRVEEFIGLNIITTLVGGLLGILLSGSVIYILLFAIIGALIPGLFLYRKKQTRAKVINDEIGESMTGMSNSLRAGYSFQQAMDLVSKETSGPLAKEYQRTMREINLGITTEQALLNLIERVGNEDLELMISAVLIQRQIGGNLAEIFDKIADTIRQRIRMKGEIKTLTAQGRISSWIIGGIPVFILGVLSLLNPAYIAMFFNSTLGLMLLAGAAVSEFIGFMFIRKITNIEF